jgi:hypothetical protein
VGKTLGKIIYLIDAPPNAEVTNTVHRDAHGLVAEAIYSVTEGDSPRLERLLAERASLGWLRAARQPKPREDA